MRKYYVEMALIMRNIAKNGVGRTIVFNAKKQVYLRVASEIKTLFMPCFEVTK